jgi:hypothetical protein
MVVPLPDLDPQWRQSADANDRELIRTYLNYPASDASLSMIIQQMNAVAAVSPVTVERVQGWLDEIIELEEIQTDAVFDGTAHLGNAREYEGVIPGTTPTRDQQLSQAGKLSWDTSVLKARYAFGDGTRSTAQGQRDERRGLLVGRIVQAVGIPYNAYTPYGTSGATLIRG